MAGCLKWDSESDLEASTYKPGFPINYNSSSTSNSSINTYSSHDRTKLLNVKSETSIEKLKKPDGFYRSFQDKNHALDSNILTKAYNDFESKGIQTDKKKLSTAEATELQANKPISSKMKYYKQRTLSPASVADRCRIAIQGCGSSYSMEGHADWKKDKLRENLKH